ncbi:uncharacterized protein LOC120104689 [Phoenix dactylifera]|uniref:Uncharacterized protein LOC120104689 n=1 Tax=Phoenix dactylifera TaxID=42345 RepID=A0A8B8ZL30_PHODC|nr:uncharacterized protein LOC120104689 [Phoenix dactylifera]
MVEVKYFIPNKSRMLVTLLGDKDVRNMHQIHVNLNASVIELVVSHILCLIEAADVVIDMRDSGPFQNVEWSCRSKFFSKGISSNFGRVVEETRAAIEEQPSQTNSLDAWKTSIEGVGLEFNDVETLRDTIRNFCIANCRDCLCEERSSATDHEMSIDIVKDIRREYGVELPYHQAWHGKEVAMKDLYGHRSKSYDRIRWYCDTILETNPGSIAEYETIEGRFKRLFISFHASVVGFIRGCRHLIFVDGTFIKHKDGGVVFSATSKDANDDMFSIAYGVVDTETNDNWDWFCQILKEAIYSCSEWRSEQITFMMDRHQGIIKSMPKYFSGSYHSYCFRHVKDNFKNQALVYYRTSERKRLLDLLKVAAYTSRLNVFHKLINKLTLEAPGSRTFLLHANPKHWANAVFPGPRWGIMTFNMVECFNSWIMEAQHLPVPQMVDHIRLQIMTLMHERGNRSYNIQTHLCPVPEKVLHRNAEDGRRLSVFTSNIMIYDVKDTNYSCKVDLQNSNCSCGEWRIFRMPYKYACARIEKAGRSLYHFTDNCFQTKLYRATYAEAKIDVKWLK